MLELIIKAIADIKVKLDINKKNFENVTLLLKNSQGVYVFSSKAVCVYSLTA